MLSTSGASQTLRDPIAALCARVTAAAPMRKSLFNAIGGILVGDLDMLQEIMKLFATTCLTANPIEVDRQEMITVLTRTMMTLRTAPLDEALEPGIR